MKVLRQFKRFFSIIRAKTLRMRKNFPGSNATLLPRFLGLCFVIIIGIFGGGGNLLVTAVVVFKAHLLYAKGWISPPEIV